MKRGGRRRSRLCAGGEESDDESEEDAEGEVRGSSRIGDWEVGLGSTAMDEGRDLAFGDRERRLGASWVGF